GIPHRRPVGRGGLRGGRQCGCDPLRPAVSLPRCPRCAGRPTPIDRSAAGGRQSFDRGRPALAATLRRPRFLGGAGYAPSPVVPDTRSGRCCGRGEPNSSGDCRPTAVQPTARAGKEPVRPWTSPRLPRDPVWVIRENGPRQALHAGADLRERPASLQLTAGGDPSGSLVTLLLRSVV